jgi:hypothetical protein
MTPNEMSFSLYEVLGFATSQLPVGGDEILITVQTVLFFTQHFHRGSQHECQLEENGLDYRLFEGF